MENKTKTRIVKIVIVLAVIVVLMIAFFLPLKMSGALDKIKNEEELRAFIQRGGMYSYALFFLVQFLQATILPIPATLTTIVGTKLFGVLPAILISLVAILTASIVSFWLGRKFGKKLVYWIVGEEDGKKYEEKLSKGKYTFFLMMLFPFFPDDILCLLVGATTNMSYRFFIITNLITRPITIIFTCLVAGNIPFHGWWLAFWGFLVLCGIILFYCSVKFEKQIENVISKISNKCTKKKDNGDVSEN